MSKKRSGIGGKGQGSPEFNVIIGFVMLIFMVVLLIVFQKQEESYQFQVLLDAKAVSRTLAGNINVISQNGNGYSKYFSVPSYLHGPTRYEVQISGNFLFLNYSGTGLMTPLITDNVSIIQLEKGEHLENCVMNEGGEVVINTICGLSNQGCGTVQSCDPMDNDNCPTCDTPDPETINENSRSTCSSYGCSDDEWHLYKVVPSVSGSLEITFTGTGNMTGSDKTDLMFYDYIADGCSSPDIVFQLEPQTTWNFAVTAGNTYIIGLDSDSTGCDDGGSYELETVLT